MDCPACHAAGLVLRIVAMDPIICCPSCAYVATRRDAEHDVAFA